MPGLPPVTRRSVLRGLGAAGAGVSAGVLTVGSARTAAGAEPPPLGAHETVDAALRRLFGTRPLTDGAAVVKLETPLIAENGAVVPVSVEVDAPMTPSAYVKHIYVVADRNRIPVVTRATLTPETGHAFVAANIRLGETGDVRAIVERSDGTLLQVKRAVRVTVGGCGG